MNQVSPRLIVAGLENSQTNLSNLNDLNPSNISSTTVYGFTAVHEVNIFDSSGAQNVRILRSREISSTDDRLFCRLINGHQSIKTTEDTAYLSADFLQDATSGTVTVEAYLVIYVVARGNGPPLYQNFYSNPIILTELRLTVNTNPSVACA